MTASGRQSTRSHWPTLNQHLTPAEAAERVWHTPLWSQLSPSLQRLHPTPGTLFLRHNPLLTSRSECSTPPGNCNSVCEEQEHHRVIQQAKALFLTMALTNQAKRQSPSQKKILQDQKI